MREDLAPLYDVARASIRKRLAALQPQGSAPAPDESEPEPELGDEDRERLLAEIEA